MTRDRELSALAQCALREENHSVEARESPPDPGEIGPWTGADRAVLLDLRVCLDAGRALAGAGAWVIALAPGERVETILEALRAGVDDYLALPLSASELREAVSRRSLAHRDVLARLEYHGDDGSVRTFALREGVEVSVGRDPDNDVRFNSQVISRHHLRIVPDGSEFRAVDPGSRHGIYLNGERVAEPARLSDGDRLRLGKPGAPTVDFRLQGAGGGERPTDSMTTGGSLPGRELKEVATLLDTFLTLNTRLVLDDVLAIVLSRTIEFAGAERGFILLTEETASDDESTRSPGVVLDDEEGTRLCLALARDRHSRPLESKEIAISRRIPGAVLRTGEGIIVEDLLAEEEAPLHLATIDLGVRSAMCVPLRPRGQAPRQEESAAPIGVLYVDSSDRTRPFSEQLLHAVESLATEAARAIVNARLWRVSLQKRQIDEEMKIAHEIQANFLPSTSWACDWLELEGHYRPCREVGGDFLNYYPQPDGAVGVLLGDVSGKGVSAAIFSAMLDGHFLSWSSRADDGPSLQDLALDLNRYLVRKSGGQKFVSFVFALLGRDGSMTFLNAGHNPPLVLREGGVVDRLEAGGMIMGLFEDATYVSGRTRLSPGDAILFYSDGVTEARNPSRALFGVDRLREAASARRDGPAHALLTAVVERLEEFAAGTPPEDDVTLLAVKRR